MNKTFILFLLKIFTAFILDHADTPILFIYLFTNVTYLVL